MKTGPRHHSLAALLALGMVSSSALALAQTPADPTVPAAPVATTSAFADTTKPVTFLKEMVVTGSRYPRAYYESPQSLSFLTRTQLREEAPGVLGDVLGELPGVDLSKDSPWEQRPVLRGLGGQRVLVMMDGSPVNSARGNGPHPSLVDPGQVERIEVVRGPSSVAYGSDALGGAINIITREGLRSVGNSFRGSATLGGSSVDRQKNAYLELMPQIGKLTAFLSSGGRRALDFSTPHDGRVHHSGFEDYNGLANLRYALSDRYSIKGGYQLYRGTDIGLPGLKTDIPGPSPGQSFLQEFRFPDYDRDAAHLSVERTDPGSWFARSQAKLYYQKEHRNFYSHEEATAPFTGPPPPSGITQITNQDRLFDLKTWGFQTQFTSRRSARYLLTAGIDFARDQTDGDNVRHRYWVDGYGTTVFTNADRITASVPDGTFDSYATFAQSEWYLSPRWTASVGGRFTHYRQRTNYGLSAPAAGPSPAVYFQPLSVDDGALSGSLGLVYSPVKDLRVTANVANGFRMPNAQDRFFNGPASVGTVLGNPALEPEKSISYDLGLRWGPGDYAVAGNLFYSTYTNLIDALDVTPAGNPPGAPSTYQYFNITEARIMGGEVESELNFLRHYQARIAMAGTIGDITNADAILQLYGIVQDRAPLPSIPPFKGTASLRWRDTSGRFWVEPSARWSWRTNRLPPASALSFFTTFKKEWMVGDLMMGARLPRGQKVVAGVRNIANRSYTQALGSLEEPGRSFVGSLTVDF